MKKISTIFSVIVFSVLFLIICSCGQKEPSETVPEWEVSDQGLTDLAGKTYYFSADIDPTSETFLSYIKNTAFGDAAMQRFRETENKFNTKI